MPASRRSVRDHLRARLGPYSSAVALYRRYRPAWWWFRANPSGRLTKRLIDQEGTTVLTGLFRGTIYPRSVVGHVGFVGPKLLGSYESEVTEFLGSCRWKTFVDIGAAEGYFCVGMGRSDREGQVIGFEMDEHQRARAEQIATENGVGARFNGTADVQTLAALRLQEPVVVLCDVEGAEWELMDTRVVGWLSAASIVIELHETARPGVTGELRDRFSSTHDIEVVQEQPRDPRAFAALGAWDPADAEFLLSEGRMGEPGVWMLLRPRPS